MGIKIYTDTPGWITLRGEPGNDAKEILTQKDLEMAGKIAFDKAKSATPITTLCFSNLTIPGDLKFPQALLGLFQKLILGVKYIKGLGSLPVKLNDGAFNNLTFNKLQNINFDLVTINNAVNKTPEMFSNFTSKANNCTVTFYEVRPAEDITPIDQNSPPPKTALFKNPKSNITFSYSNQAKFESFATVKNILITTNPTQKWITFRGLIPDAAYVLTQNDLEAATEGAASGLFTSTLTTLRFLNLTIPGNLTFPPILLAVIKKLILGSPDIKNLGPQPVRLNNGAFDGLKFTQLKFIDFAYYGFSDDSTAFVPSVFKDFSSNEEIYILFRECIDQFYLQGSMFINTPSYRWYNQGHMANVQPDESKHRNLEELNINDFNSIPRALPSASNFTPAPTPEPQDCSSIEINHINTLHITI